MMGYPHGIVSAEEVNQVALVRTRTDFSAQDHGFRFVNSFEFSLEFDLPFASPIDLGNIIYGLCGGMCFAALDYFHAGRPIPDEATIPPTGSGLHRYLWQRQLDSLSLPVGPLKVIEWMLREDEDLGRQIARSELRKLRTRLDRGDPAVLVLIRAHGVANPTHNHQAVAVAYGLDETPTAKRVTIHLYDPNYPGEEPRLTMDLKRPGLGIHAQQSSGDPFRGFFVLDYRRKTPP